MGQTTGRVCHDVKMGPEVGGEGEGEGEGEGARPGN
jgi:hypothetical protein